MLELARNMARMKPKRSIIFVAFSGEEAGLTGSRYFVEHFDDYFKGKPFADVNLDTDGSLFDKKLLVLNGNTAREWKFIFMGTDYTTGVKSEVLTTDLDASDQIAFIEKGIPAVQLFTGATENYHRPSDTWEKIDSSGLVKVATVAKEVVEYLANRTDPISFTGETAGHKTNSPASSGTGSRRASTGSVPDFAFAGPGVRIGSVIENSAAAKAGLKKGDIILEVNGEEVKDLRGYTGILKKYRPGDKAQFTILRNGKEIKANLVFDER
jgi:membrane-associated protease RseP (regulator of RpoE activity)